MKTKSKRTLGIKIAVCGAVLAAIALTALRMPRSALAVVSSVKSATWCEVVCNRAASATEESEPLTPGQLDAQRAALLDSFLA